MFDGPILSPGSVVGGRDVGAFIRGGPIGPPGAVPALGTLCEYASGDRPIKPTTAMSTILFIETSFGAPADDAGSGIVFSIFLL